MMKPLTSVTAFAPATSANVAVGFDILGFALEQLGDTVTLTKSVDPKLRIASISGTDQLPYEIEKNSATVALLAMLDHLGLPQNFELHLQKKIPLGSGLGGSAASSVAPLVALNAFLTDPLSLEELVQFALYGEEIACGAKHGDNVIPSLYGGITLVHSLVPLQIIPLPVIPLIAVLVHPHLRLDTRDSRAALKKTIELSSFIKQSAHLAAFISALYEENYDRLAMACKDELIEGMRAHLIPGFYEVQDAAMINGALACSISGSGPTMFALTTTEKQAEQIAEAMRLAFQNQGIESDSIISPIASRGAHVISEA
ncbi:MAG: homoserine kinase [Legionella sp.]|nr:MAG: homoserine kinase [Legionella sp.]